MTVFRRCDGPLFWQIAVQLEDCVKQSAKPSVLPVMPRLQFLASVGISFLISSFTEHEQNRTSTTFLKTSGSIYLQLMDACSFGAMFYRCYQVCTDSVKKHYLKIVKSEPSPRLSDHSFWCSEELNAFWVSQWVFKECNILIKLEFSP